MPKCSFSRILIISFLLLFFIPAYPILLNAMDSSGNMYEALNPWGETDPGELGELSSRLDNLEGKKIGIYANYKRSAIPIAITLKEWLESMYPDSKISIYNSDKQKISEIDTKRSETFKSWAKGNDAVILLVGS